MFKSSSSVYQSTARTGVSYAEAKINTKLAVDPPIHIFTNRVFSQPSNSILLLGSREIVNPSDSNISTLPSLWY